MYTFILSLLCNGIMYFMNIIFFYSTLKQFFLGMTAFFIAENLEIRILQAKYFYVYLFYFMYMGILFVCLYITYVQYPQKPENVLLSPRTGGPDSILELCGYHKSGLNGQPMPLSVDHLSRASYILLNVC